MEFRKMTTQQWANVLDNPRQRDTEKHAAQAIRRHLKVSCSTQARVDAAMLPGGILVKLDGHTRSFLWEAGKLESPKVVYVTIYPVENMEKAKELYTHFDSDGPLEKSRDKVFGAFREIAFTPESGLLKHGALTSILKNLNPKTLDVYASVRAWKRELILLDSLGFSKNQLLTGASLGALILLRKHGENALLFLDKVRKNSGTKTAEGSDSVDMLARYTATLKGKSGGEQSIKNLAGVVISFYRGFIANKRYLKNPPAMDAILYLRGSSNG